MNEAAPCLTMEDGEQLLLFPEAPRPEISDRWLVRHYSTPEGEPDRVDIDYQVVFARNEDEAYAAATPEFANLNVVATRLADGEEAPSGTLELYPMSVTGQFIAHQNFKKKFAEGLDLAERALTTLDSFIADHSDPGTEALAVSWCLGKLLEQHGRQPHGHHEATLRGLVEEERSRWTEAIEELLQAPESPPEPSLEATLALITAALENTRIGALLEAARWADEEARHRRAHGGEHAANLLEWVSTKLCKRAQCTPKVTEGEGAARG